MKRALGSLLLALFVVLLGVPGIASAAPQDLTVNVTDDHDDGSCDAWTPETDCTLREAINASNASPEPGTISFDIHDASEKEVQTITPESALPDITAPVTIDGYTEPGASPNTLDLPDGDNARLRIELDGTLAGGNGLTIDSAESLIRGLVLNRFGTGIVIQGEGANGNAFRGNFIGVDPRGTVGEGNGNGIAFSDAGVAPDSNVIGGGDPADRNVVSGNGGVGILTGHATGTLIQGNYVGLSASGAVAVGNASSGIRVFVGAGTVVSGNVISGNFMGVDAQGPADVFGNVIGLNAAMTSALPNTFQGVNAVNTANGTPVRVGGLGPGMGNVIAGNGAFGVEVTGVTATVEGNWIGTNPSGADFGNGDSGVDIRSQLGSTPLGVSIRGNTIEFNQNRGIAIRDGFGDTIQDNSIDSNLGIGIDLNLDGVSPNDPGDTDPGANRLQNFPVLTHVVRDVQGTQIQGTLNSTPQTQFDVEAFSSPSCDSSGFGEGARSLGSFQVWTDGGGDASFAQLLGASAPAGSAVTATATAPDGSTSEFSACQTVDKPKVDLALAKEDSPNIVAAGDEVTYTITVANNGPNTASGVGLSDPLPSTASFVSVSPSQGSCAGTSTVVCQLGTVAKGGSATVTLVARLSTAGSVTNTATVDGTETDTNLANNTASAITIVTPNADGCTVVGTGGNDYLAGTAGDDVICGLGGNDTLIGKKGADTLYGGDGNDVLKGGAGNDTIYGDDGNDTAVGGQGFDSVLGGVGADVLRIKDGAGGNDSADGGIDADVDVCKADVGDVVTNCP